MHKVIKGGTIVTADLTYEADVRVDVPGGSLTVTRTSSGSLVLTGPAVLVADGTLSESLSGMFL